MCECVTLCTDIIFTVFLKSCFLTNEWSEFLLKTRTQYPAVGLFPVWMEFDWSCVCVQGANALVTYAIISGADDSFRIDPESGELTAIRRLDRERRSKYSLLVRADDGQQSSDVRVNITVSDVNDHAPHFSRNVYSFDIPEDTSPGMRHDNRSLSSDRCPLGCKAINRD